MIVEVNLLGSKKNGGGYFEKRPRGGAGRRGGRPIEERWQFPAKESDVMIA